MVGCPRWKGAFGVPPLLSTVTVREVACGESIIAMARGEESECTVVLAGGEESVTARTLSVVRGGGGGGGGGGRRRRVAVVMRCMDKGKEGPAGRPKGVVVHELGEGEAQGGRRGGEVSVAMPFAGVLPALSAFSCALGATGEVSDRIVEEGWDVAPSSHDPPPASVVSCREGEDGRVLGGVRVGSVVLSHDEDVGRRGGSCGAASFCLLVYGRRGNGVMGKKERLPGEALRVVGGRGL